MEDLISRGIAEDSDGATCVFIEVPCFAHVRRVCHLQTCRATSCSHHSLVNDEVSLLLHFLKLTAVGEVYIEMGLGVIKFCDHQLLQREQALLMVRTSGGGHEYGTLDMAITQLCDMPLTCVHMPRACRASRRR